MSKCVPQGIKGLLIKCIELLHLQRQIVKLRPLPDGLHRYAIKLCMQLLVRDLDPLDAHLCDKLREHAWIALNSRPVVSPRHVSDLSFLQSQSMPLGP